MSISFLISFDVKSKKEEKYLVGKYFHQQNYLNKLLVCTYLN